MTASGPGVDQLGLQPGEDPQGLCVALEATTTCGDFVEDLLAVVPEGRVADVVRQSGGLHHVWVAAQLNGDPAADLGDFQRVGQPGPGYVTLPGTDHLGLTGKPPQCRGVQHPGPVPSEGTAALRCRSG